MKVSFINIDLRLKKMEDYIDITNYQTYTYEYKSKLND